MNLATQATDPTLKALLRLAIFLNVFVKFKDESKFMWLIDRVIARLFNPTFMTRFTTTIGSTIYFTSEASVLLNQLPRAKTMAHEFVHAYDKKKHGLIKYDLAYLFPQILAVPALPHLLPGLLLGALMPGMISAWVTIGLATLTTTLLGFFLLGPWTLILLAFLVFAAPIPAYWRMKWEVRGYTMSMAMNYWKHGSIMPSTIEWMATHFTSMNYYAMWPFKKSMIKRLNQAADDIRSGKVLEDPIFRQVHNAMKGPPPEGIAP